MGERMWFPRRSIDGFDVWAVLTALLIFVALGGMGAPLLARLALALLWPVWLYSVALAGADRGIRVDDHGITVVPWRGPEQHYPWDTVQGVRYLPAAQLLILLADTSIAVETDRHPGWRRLLRTIETRLAGDQGDAVSRDEVIELLGCDPERGLTCSARVRWLRLGPVALAGPLVGAGAWPAALLVVGASWWWATLDQRRHRVRADAHGLEIRRGLAELHVAWSEVDTVEVSAAPYARFYLSPEHYAADALVRLDTVHGPVEWLHSDRGGRALADAIRRVLEARAEGRRLPDPGLLNNASLSPARATGAESERSISLARD